MATFADAERLLLGQCVGTVRGTVSQPGIVSCEDGAAYQITVPPGVTTPLGETLLRTILDVVERQPRHSCLCSCLDLLLQLVKVSFAAVSEADPWPTHGSGWASSYAFADVLELARSCQRSWLARHLAEVFRRVAAVSCGDAVRFVTALTPLHVRSVAPVPSVSLSH